MCRPGLRDEPLYDDLLRFMALSLIYLLAAFWH